MLGLSVEQLNMEAHFGFYTNRKFQENISRNVNHGLRVFTRIVI